MERNKEEEVTKKKNQRDSQRRRWQGDYALYLRRAPLHFEARTLNSTQSLQQPFKMQTSAAMSSMMRKKKETDITGLFFQEDRVCRTEFSNTPEPVSSMTGMREMLNLTSISSC